MTTFFLIRHASHDLLGKALAGRAPGLHLNERGRGEAKSLAQRLSRVPLEAVYTSPRERACETAQPLASGRNLEVQINAAIDEIDFGDWTGRTFQELREDAVWSQWVERRSEAQVPNGERIAQVQNRVVEEIERLADTHESRALALVSHGDVIKAVLARFLGISLDSLELFDVAPASVSVLRLERHWSRVTLLNDHGAFESG